MEEVPSAAVRRPQGPPRPEPRPETFVCGGHARTPARPWGLLSGFFFLILGRVTNSTATNAAKSLFWLVSSQEGERQSGSEGSAHAGFR